MGTDPEALTREDLPVMASGISPILRVFLGPEAAARLAAEIASFEGDE
jgi:hypothetical protein